LKQSKDHIKRTLQSIHFNAYYLYTKGLNAEVAEICSLIPLYQECSDDIENEDKKSAIHKTLLELGSIAWNTAFKILVRKSILILYKIFDHTSDAFT